MIARHRTRRRRAAGWAGVTLASILLIAFARLLPQSVSDGPVRAQDATDVGSSLAPDASPALIVPGAGRSPAPPDVSGSGRIVGTVTDLASGLPIAGATVRAGDALGLTDARGTFRLSLPAGRYRVRVSASGYHGATALDHELDPLRADGASRVDVGLPPVLASAADAAAVAAALRPEPELVVEPEPGVEAASEDVAAPPPVSLLASAVITDTLGTVRVLMTDGRIVSMGMEEYLKGVIPAEMGWVFRRNFMALAAQAIASRTYAATRCLPETAGDPARCERGLDANVDTTTRTQVWRPVHYDISDAAVEATRGQVARSTRDESAPGQALVETLFFARALDRTLDSEQSPCCGGRRITHLRSVASPDPFAARWGHGAGMSQEGAAVLADWGATAEEIVDHYYTGARVRLPEPPGLYDAGVEPREGGLDQVYTFRVGYRDEDGDRPRLADLVLDGEVRPMALQDEAGPIDHRLGSTWIHTSTLEAGAHAFSFRFSDGFTPVVEIDGGEVLALEASAAGAEPIDPAADLEIAGDDDGAVDAASDGEEEADAGRVRAGAVDLQVPATARAEDLSAAAAPELAPGVIYEAPIQEAGFPFMALAVRWTERESTPESGAEVDDAALAVEARVSADGGAWSAWQPLVTDDDGRREIEVEDYWTHLLIARGRFVQVRFLDADGESGSSGPEDSGNRPSVDGLTIHYLDADGGPRAPLVSAATAGRGAAAPEDELTIAALAAEGEEGPPVLSRAAWGADESLRRDEDGDLIWPAFYTQPRALIVHHTVTSNDPVDPAAIVRSIYHFHAVTRGWGDVGYNFLVDERGNIYEGRAGGERDGRITQGGHARQYNSNSIGVAVLGTFTAREQSVRAAAYTALVELLASRALRYEIDPTAAVTLAGTRFAHSIMGHRDALPGHTVCPGDGLHGQLPGLRTNVIARVAELGGGAQPTSPPPPPPPPTATPRPTSTPGASPTPLPTGCTELVADGGFEAGDETAWRLNRAFFTRWDVRRGLQAMFVGLRDADPDDVQSYASAVQTLRVPETIDRARLNFAAKTSGQPSDRRLVRLFDADGRVAGLGGITLPPQSDWTDYEADLTSVFQEQAGQELTLYFGIVNDGDGRKSLLRLDDVSVTACGPLSGGSVPSETPSPTASVTPEADAYPAPATPDSEPSAGATATLPPVPTTTVPRERPLACAALVDVGGFDEPTLEGWGLVGDQPVVQVDQPRAAGAGSLQLGLLEGDEDGFGYAGVRRPVQLPREVVSGTVSLWLRPRTVAAGDVFVVELRRAWDGARHLLLAGPPPGSSERWTRLTLPIDDEVIAALGLDKPDAPAAAHNLTLYLALLNRVAVGPSESVTALYIDELGFEACARPRDELYFPAAIYGP